MAKGGSGFPERPLWLRVERPSAPLWASGLVEAWMPSQGIQAGGGLDAHWDAGQLGWPDCRELQMAALSSARVVQGRGFSLWWLGHPHFIKWDGLSCGWELVVLATK